MKKINEYLVNGHVSKMSINTLYGELKYTYNNVIKLYNEILKGGDEVKLDPSATVVNIENLESPGTVTAVRLKNGIVELFITWSDVISESTWDDVSQEKYYIEDLMYILDLLYEMQ